jgi:trigger factor
MKTTVESPDPIHRTISIELPWDMLSEELDREYRQLAGKVQLKGFRKGHVPRNVLRQRYGHQVHADVLARLIQEAYEAALIQNRIQPVALPELERGEFKEGQPYAFTAKVEVQPVIELTKVSGFDVAVEPVEVTAEAVEQEIERLREARAVLLPIEGRSEAHQGDTAILDYTASQAGKPLEGGQKQDHHVELGSGSTVPGFEDAIVGMQVGQTRQFELTFPTEGFPATVAGKAIGFEVILKALKRRELPAFDDDFAKDLSEKDVSTVADVRAMVERRLREGLEAKALRDARTRLIDQLVAANPFPVPPSLVDRQKAGMFQELQQMLRFQGLNPDQISAHTDKMLEDLGPRAEREVVSALLLNAVAEKEGIQVEEAELEKHLAEVAEKSGENLARLRALYADANRLEELKINLRRDKVVDHLMKLSNMEPASAEPGPQATDAEETAGSKTPTGDAK